MAFLAKMYERRFNENMNRHRLDAKIAPSRPKPACRPFTNDHYLVQEQKQETLNRFFVAQEVKEQTPINVVPAPTTYFDKPDLVSNNSRSNLFAEVNKPALVVEEIKPMKRSGSSESGFHTGGDSDVASNLSFAV